MTYPTARSTKFCYNCGSVIDALAVVCPACGVTQSPPVRLDQSDKRILPALILCFFLGLFGAHRFYSGKIGTGILQLVTLGGLGIWALIDFILIVTGSFTDEDGNKISAWT